MEPQTRLIYYFIIFLYEKYFFWSPGYWLFLFPAANFHALSLHLIQEFRDVNYISKFQWLVYSIVLNNGSQNDWECFFSPSEFSLGHGVIFWALTCWYPPTRLHSVTTQNTTIWITIRHVINKFHLNLVQWWVEVMTNCESNIISWSLSDPL